MDYTFRAQADEGSEWVTLILTAAGRGYAAWAGQVMFSALSLHSKIANRSLTVCDPERLVCTFRVNRGEHPDWKSVANHALGNARRMVAKRRGQFPAVTSCWEV